MATVTVVKDRTTVVAGSSGKTWIANTLIQRTFQVKGGTVKFSDGRVQHFGQATMRVGTVG